MKIRCIGITFGTIDRFSPALSTTKVAQMRQFACPSFTSVSRPLYKVQVELTMFPIALENSLITCGRLSSVLVLSKNVFEHSSIIIRPSSKTV